MEKHNLTLVDDPYTGETLDITSLFDFLNYFQNDDSKLNLNCICRAMDDTFMMMARGMDNDILTEEPEAYRRNMDFMSKLKTAIGGVRLKNELKS